jgi:hypothetical protein
LLMLLHPDGNPDDEKEKRVENRLHCCGLSCRR